MKKEIKFLKGDTRTGCVVSSVLFSLSIIILAMLALLLQLNVETKSITLFGVSAVLVLIANIFFGALQIKVFKDYKSQTKSLCAEGIFNICLTVLIVATLMLWVILGGFEASSETFDLRWFIGVFALAFAVWKVFTVKTSIKEKRKNWCLEIIIGLLWIAIGTLCFVSIYNSSATFNWAFMAVDSLMVVVYVVYILLTYIFNTPTYLETEEGLAILNQEQIDRQNRLARLNTMMGGGFVNQPQQQEPAKQSSTDDIEVKLEKLASLKEKGVITAEEYEAKRKDIINKSL